MKHYLLPENGQFYKACLHTHTNCSDGAFSPEEVKRMYKAEGYSVVAFTDHDIMLSHNDLNDEDFLTITSFELALNQPKALPYAFMKVYHLNLYSPVAEPEKNPFFCEARVHQKNAKPLVTDDMRKVNYALAFSQDDVNKMIRDANREGYLVCYNHPVWSLQNYPDYCELKGLWGVEVYNTGCVVEGYPDTVQPYEDFQHLGERVFPVAADDSHGTCDTFGGYVLVKAEELKYDAVFSALKNGDFYASSGPRITELFLEDGVLHIECSPAAAITVNTERRAVRILEKGETPLTHVDVNLSAYLEASAGLPKEEFRPYFRVTVTDENAKSAWTRCYYLDEIDPEKY